MSGATGIQLTRPTNIVIPASFRVFVLPLVHARTLMAVSAVSVPEVTN